MTDENVVELVGLFCPETILRTMEALHRVSSNELLTILVDDQESLGSIIAKVKDAGHKIEQVTQENAFFKIVIRKLV